MFDSLLAPSSLLLFSCLALVGYSVLRKKTPPRPPGPKGYPVIGNVFDMPGVDECFTFAKWREQYGDLVSLDCAGTSIIITNSYSSSIALLEKKSGIYCNRPDAPMATELVGWKNNLAFLQYGKRFREGRKLFHIEFGSPAGLGRFEGMQEEESRRLIRRLLEGKGKGGFDRAISKHAGALIMRVAYGYEKQDHILTALVNKVMKAAALATAPSHFWVNMMPWLKHIPAWVPGASFQRIAAEWRRDMMEMVDKPFEFVKKGMREGTAPESFTSSLLSNPDAKEKEETIKWLAGTMFSGGADTTYSTILSFILAMSLHPSVQHRAQSEIDKITGSERLPTFNDRKEMVYLDWVVMEVLRWFSVVPIGIPHVSVQDDIHEGYFIPKGSIVFQNLWLMSHDPKVYKNPDVFDPLRFSPERAEQDPREYCFGFGRRACPGRHLADMTVWITVVRILATFDILPKGAKAEVKAAPGIVTHPVSFDCDIMPRKGREGWVRDVVGDLEVDDADDS